MELVQDEAFFALFHSFTGTAFHVEGQDSYHTPDEAGPFELFLTQQDDDLAWHQPWLNLVRNITAAGKNIQRVRVVTVPHVDYTRWGLTIAPHNIAAGEDIRWLPRHLIRWYEPLLVPGILHTAEYAEAVMRRVIEFYEIPDDLDAGVSARMERRQILYRSNHKFHFIVTQQALLTTVGDSSVMIGQLDRLLAAMFDDIELYDMHYTLDGTWLGAEPVTDPSRIK